MNLSDDPRAASFPEDTFRDAISFAMQMGMPEEEELRPTFQWDVDASYDIADPSGQPYSWTEEATDIVTHDDVQPICSVKFIPSTTRDINSPFGPIENPKAIINLSDVEYAKVEGADKVVLGGNTYFIKFIAPEDALFGVTFYNIYVEAYDEAGT